MRSVSVPQLSLAVRQRADLAGQGNAFGSNTGLNITDVEMLTMLNASYSEFWDLQIQCYGDNYQWSVYNLPIVQGTYQYQLPFDFYKEFGVDFSLDNTGVNWATVRPYTLRDRNQFSFPLQTALAYQGWQNIRWQMQGQVLNFLPQLGPLPGLVRLLYAPACPVLCATMPTLYAASTVYAAGAYVYVAPPLPVTTQEIGNPVYQVYQAVVGGTSSASGIGSLKIGASTTALTYIPMTSGFGDSTLANNVLGTFSVSENALSVYGATFGGSPGNYNLAIDFPTSTPASTIAATLNGMNLGPTSALGPGQPLANYVRLVAGGSSNHTAGSGTLTAWSVPGTTVDNNITWAYQGPLSLFQTTLDGINGGDDYVVLDTVIKAGVKQEMDVSAFMAQKAALTDRIRRMLENRQAGDAMVISGGFGTAEGGPGAGFGFGTGAGGGWGFD